LLISIDLGYGYTKAVSENNRIIFPSVLAPAEEGLDYGQTIGHVLEFRKPGEIQKRRVFVGNLAQREGRAVQVSLSRDKFVREMSVALALAAAYLVGVEGRIDLALGLPVAYYKSQKQQVERVFSGIATYVSVDGGPEKYISFSRVHVFPQAVGALYARDELPEQGLVGMVDVGFHTTDYLLVQCLPEDIAPLKGYTSSLETGVATALKLFANRFAQVTSVPLGISEAHDWWVSGRREVKFRGRPVDVGSLMDAARGETGQAIGEAIAASWSERADWIEAVYLAGGGAVEFAKELQAFFPQAEVLPEAQLANALGFFKLAGGVYTREARSSKA
jgi:plasmid segregation protein ParM